MLLPMFPRFTSRLVKSENILLLNLKERMKKIVNFEPFLLVWKKTKSGVERNEVRNETYVGAINRLKR